MEVKYSCLLITSILINGLVLSQTILMAMASTEVVSGPMFLFISKALLLVHHRRRRHHQDIEAAAAFDI
ncbi:hypothetical protein AB3S75_018456 [Citrus x aurantiifolia]